MPMKEILNKVSKLFSVKTWSLCNKIKHKSTKKIYTHGCQRFWSWRQNITKKERNNTKEWVENLKSKIESSPETKSMLRKQKWTHPPVTKKSKTGRTGNKRSFVHRGKETKKQKKREKIIIICSFLGRRFFL